MKTKIMTIREAESKVNFDIIDHQNNEAIQFLNEEIEIVLNDDDTVDFLSLPMREKICTEPYKYCSEIFE